MAGSNKNQLEHLVAMRKLALYQQIAKYFFLCLGVCFTSFCIYLCVRSLAGQMTTATFLISVIGKLTMPRALPITLLSAWGVAGTSWGALERRAKKKMIARLHPMARKAQLAIDPNKGSSGITLTGDTGPEDA